MQIGKGVLHCKLSLLEVKVTNITASKANINNYKLIKYPKTSATDSAQQWDSVLSILIDLHAPLVSKMISPSPWMTLDICSSKRHRRYHKRIWQRNLMALNISRFTRQTHLCNRLMSIAKHSGDHQSLWRHLTKSFTVA